MCTLASVKSAAQASPLMGRTTALLWRPAAEHWRDAESGTSGAVLGAALAALDSPGYRCPLPAPTAAQVAALAQAGMELNEAVRARYVRGAEVGAVSAAATAVAAAARALGAGQPRGVGAAVLCVGKRDRLVYLRADPRLHAAMLSAAKVNGMSFGAWVRDGVAAELAEHQARRPAAETRDGRTVAGRVAGLLVAAGAVAAGGGEVGAVGVAEEALAAAVERLGGWGSRR